MGAVLENDMPASYEDYRMSTVQKLISLLTAGTVLFAAGYIFYGNFVLSLVASCLAWLYVPVRRKQLAKKRLQILRLQFKEWLPALSSALTVGKSVQNALIESTADLRRMEGGVTTYMLRELDWINLQLQNGVTVLEALGSFAERSGMEDIRNFAEVFTVCSRSGGNLLEVVRRTSQWISEKLELEQEMAVVIAQKRWEANALSVMPFLLIALMRVSSPEYMEPLYDGIGRLVMTAGLLLLLAAVWWIRKLVDIRV